MIKAILKSLAITIGIILIISIIVIGFSVSGQYLGDVGKLLFLLFLLFLSILGAVYEEENKGE